MNELERRLKDSLNEVKAAHQASIEPHERFAARRELMTRLRRRRTARAVGLGAAGVAAVAAALFIVARTEPLGREPDIDPVGSAEVTAPLSSVPVGAVPADIAVGGEGYVWTANAGDDSVTRVDPEAGEALATLDVPGRPGDIAIASGPVWVALPESGSVVRVDFAAQSASDPVEVTPPGIEMELTVGEGALFVVAKGDSLFRLDTSSLTPQPLDITDAPIDVAVREGIGYVLDADGSVTAFDQSDGGVIGGMASVAPGPEGDLIYAAKALWHFSGTDGRLVKLDPDTGQEVARFEADGTVLDLAIDNQVAWVLVRDLAGVHRLVQVDRDDAATIGDPIVLGGIAQEAAIVGGSLWVAETSSGMVLGFDKTG